MARARRIPVCWPNPDKVCMQGGCIHCEDHTPRSVETIRDYAREHGWLQDFEEGLEVKRRG